MVRAVAAATMARQEAAADRPVVARAAGRAAVQGPAVRAEPAERQAVGKAPDRAAAPGRIVARPETPERSTVAMTPLRLVASRLVVVPLAPPEAVARIGEAPSGSAWRRHPWWLRPRLRYHPHYRHLCDRARIRATPTTAFAAVPRPFDPSASRARAWLSCSTIGPMRSIKRGSTTKRFEISIGPSGSGQISLRPLTIAATITLISIATFGRSKTTMRRFDLILLGLFRCTIAAAHTRRSTILAG